MNVFEGECFRPWLCSAFVNVESNTRYAAGDITPALRESLPDVHSTKANPHCRPDGERGTRSLFDDQQPASSHWAIRSGPSLAKWM